MKTYRHILLATDCAADSKAIREHTVALAAGLGADISLLKVLEHLPQDVPNEPVPPEDVDKIEWFTGRALDELREYAQGGGITADRASVVVTTDSPEQEISRFVNRLVPEIYVFKCHT